MYIVTFLPLLPKYNKVIRLNVFEIHVYCGITLFPNPLKS